MKGLALRALNGELQDRTYAIHGDLVVGRADDCDVSIPDPRLSRHHARFFGEGGAFFVEDLGSPNGTIVNDRRVPRSELEPGDVVTLGKTRLMVIEVELEHHEPLTPFDRMDLPEQLEDEPTAASAPAIDPTEHTDPQLTTVVKPVRQTLAPDLADMRIEDYYTALGVGDDTVLDMRADRLATLVRNTRNFAVLHEVSRAIQKEHDAREMIGRVLTLIATVTRADRVYAGLTDEGGAVKTGIVRMRAGEKPSPKDRVTISQTVAEHVLRGRSAVISHDPTADERFQSSASLMLTGTRSLMASPILNGDRLLGLIQVESSHLRDRFTENDLDLLSVVASMVGVAVDNLRLADEREDTIQKLEAAQSQLIAAQEQIVRSEQLAAVGRFAAGIAHEIKNQLSPFMLADVIARRYPDDQQTRDAAEMMREAQQYILDLVNEIRAFTSGRESSIEKSPHDLAALVERVVLFAECDAKIAKAKISVDVRERPIVALDPRGFRQVLINLIKNAADALPERGGTIRLTVDGNDLGASVEVEDNGKGIPPEIGARVFEPFFTTKGEKGLGLGLDISRKIVTDHGGTMIFDSPPGHGTRFRIELPLS